MDTTFTNDIALVRLSQPVEYTQWVSPVRLPRIDAPRKYFGYTAYVSGWGVRGPGKGPSKILKGAELTVSIVYVMRPKKMVRFLGNTILFLFLLNKCHLFLQDR